MHRCHPPPLYSWRQLRKIQKKREGFFLSKRSTLLQKVGFIFPRLIAIMAKQCFLFLRRPTKNYANYRCKCVTAFISGICASVSRPPSYADSVLSRQSNLVLLWLESRTNRLHSWYTFMNRLFDFKNSFRIRRKEMVTKFWCVKMKKKLGTPCGRPHTKLFFKSLLRTT